MFHRVVVSKDKKQSLEPLGSSAPDGVPGTWYIGDPPVNPASDASPIVFVHGLNSSSKTWIQDNDMDELANRHGWQTVFVDVFPDKDMFDNGEILTQMLKEITDYFKETVVIVAHSKGGIDTQTALVYFDSSDYVERVITLSSPHLGSPLADLAYSSWAGWLSESLGNKNAGTYCLQTGYMSNYRRDTDRSPLILNHPFYTFGGTGWGSFGTSLFWGGLYLKSYGVNDGAVTVDSSRLSYAKEISVQDWNHFEIKQGSSTFALFESFLNESYPIKQPLTAAAGGNLPSSISDTYLHGGNYRGSTTEHFLVEDDVNSMVVSWTSDQESSSLTLISPDGTEHDQFVVHKDSVTPFEGAYHHMLSIQQPTPGEWKLTARSTEENYLLSVVYDSLINQSLDLHIDTQFNANIHPKGSFAVPSMYKQLQAKLKVDFYKKGVSLPDQISSYQLTGVAAKNITDYGKGVYNLTIDIHGRTLTDHEFNRTMIKTLYLDDARILHKR
ncbi:hypothetical protein Q7A53_15255 [Halobacillus rhizosphaerae]|uniref:esterase/lipase family protein n=1 Tax=Halobacillus rhizosphaerae TaxID=3064889 RepID=UPI00398B9320